MFYELECGCVVAKIGNEMVLVANDDKEIVFCVNSGRDKSHADKIRDGKYTKCTPAATKHYLERIARYVALGRRAEELSAQLKSMMVQAEEIHEW